MPDKPQLTEEQRAQLKAAVIASVRDVLRQREDLKEQAATARQVWHALMTAPSWSIAQIQRPEGMVPGDELWSLKPTVVKQ